MNPEDVIQLLRITDLSKLRKNLAKLCKSHPGLVQEFVQLLEASKRV